MTNHHHHGHEADRGAGTITPATMPGARRGWRRLLAPLVHAHSHDAAGHVGEVEASAEGMRALRVSVVGLMATATVQVAVVVLSGSVALLADTVHNFSDALTAVPLGLAFVLARRQPNRRYTYGYGRAEDLAGTAIVAAIALSAAVAAWQAVGSLVEPRDLHHAGWVAAAGVVGFVGNEAVAVYRIRVGRRIGSAALVADGLHARTDGLTSLAVVGAAAGSLAGWRLADPIVGLGISAAIANVLRVAARDIYRRLMDSVDPQLVELVDTELAATPGVRSIDRVRVRWIGHQLYVDAEVVLDAQLALAHAHDILEDARHRLLHHIPRLTDALLHPSPTSPGGDPHAATRHHFATS